MIAGLLRAPFSCRADADEIARRDGLIRICASSMFVYPLFPHKEVHMAENKGLTFKGRPLMRKDNIIYYGSMADSHIVQLQIIDYKKVGDTDVANKVAIQLQLTDPNIKGRAQIVKKAEKVGLYTALDLGAVWLERALAGK
jgi:hypothetical protein